MRAMISAVIDPGHGGVDAGAVGKSGLKEKDVVLKIARKIARRANGVTLSREKDVYMSLFARAAPPPEKAAGLFISLHVNSALSAAAGGVETQIYNRGGESEKLGAALQSALVRATGLGDRGVRLRPDLALLRLAQRPAAVVEIGFLSNETEEKRLMSDAFLNQCAAAIAEVIGSYSGEGRNPCVENLIRDGVADDPDYWQKVFEDRERVKLDRLRRLLGRYHQKLSAPATGRQRPR